MKSTAEILRECSVLGALQNCDFICFILGRRESESEETMCLFEPHRLASGSSVDRRVRQENASGSSSYPRALFRKRKWMCVCTAPSPIYKRDKFLLPCFMLRSGVPVLH